MSTPIWQDRRGMFQKGRELHEPSTRRLSGSSGDGVAGAGVGGGIMDAVRRASVTSNNDPTAAAATNPTAARRTSTAGSAGSPPPPAASASPTAQQRRRSSNTGGLFGGLANMKRGSEDYSDQRASHSDTQATSGLFGGWYNKTFKGIGDPDAAAAAAPTGTSQQPPPPTMGGGQQQQAERRGVME